MSTELKMPNSITQLSFFCKTCILAKQVKYIPNGLNTKVGIPGGILHTDLVGLVIPIGYNGSKYGLLLTNNAIRAITKVLLKRKSQVKIEFLKYTTKF